MPMFALAQTPNTKQCKISNTNYENWKDYFVKENNTNDKLIETLGVSSVFLYQSHKNNLFIVYISYFQPFLYEQLRFEVLVLI